MVIQPTTTPGRISAGGSSAHEGLFLAIGRSTLPRADVISPQGHHRTGATAGAISFDSEIVIPLSESLADAQQNPRSAISGRVIAYDDQLDVTVFLTNDERVIVHDGHTMNTWTLADPASELHDCLPPGQYTQAMSALGRYSLRT
jgi:hypothetical protein